MACGKPLMILGVLLTSMTAGCNGDPFAHPDGSDFVPPSNAVQIGESDVYFFDAVPASTLTPSTSSTAPRITGVTVEQTAETDYTISIEVESESDRPIGDVLIDFGEHGTYKVRPGPATGDDFDESICEVAESSGLTCTAACLVACGCLRCGSDIDESAAQHACAVSCSSSFQNGALEYEPYYGSEARFVSVLFDGDTELGIPGIGAQLGCSTTQCRGSDGSDGTASNGRRVINVPFQMPPIEFSTAVNFAPQVVNTEPVPEPSQNFAAGKLAPCSPCNANTAE